MTINWEAEFQILSEHGFYYDYNAYQVASVNDPNNIIYVQI